MYKYQIKNVFYLNMLPLKDSCKYFTLIMVCDYIYCVVYPYIYFFFGLPFFRTTNEEKIQLRLGTSDLLDYLLEKNKMNNIEEEFTLAMGVDTFMDLTSYKWRRPKDIIQMVEGRFIVKLRNTDDSVDKREILERISRVNSDLENDKLHTRMDVHLITEAVSSVSSTAARNTSDEEKLSMHLDQSIIDYIKVNKLYKFSSN